MSDVRRVRRQRKRSGKREPSPHTPIREKGEEKERKKEGKEGQAEILPPVIDVHTPPTLDLVLAFAHKRLNFRDDTFTTAWFKMMQDEFQWRDADGSKIRNWPMCFRSWRGNDTTLPRDTPIKAKPAAKNEVSAADIDRMFDAFWDAYPSGSRKVNKKRCRQKFAIVLGKDSDKAVSKFNAVMNGLSNWKSCYDWQKNGGEFICAPLVWLNQERWETNPANSGGNPHSGASRSRRLDNYITTREEQTDTMLEVIEGR